MAKGERVEPLANVPEEAPLMRELILDFAETDAERMLFMAKNLLQTLLHTLAERLRLIAFVTRQKAIRLIRRRRQIAGRRIRLICPRWFARKRRVLLALEPVKI